MKKKDEEMMNCCKDKFFNKGHNHCHCKSGGGSGAIYGLGVVGALFYYLQNATGLMMVLTGIGKAFFWPAILMFELLSYLQM